MKVIEIIILFMLLNFAAYSQTVEQREYYDNGQPESIGRHDKNGDETGVWKYYHENGQLAAIGSNITGEPTGEWKEYYRNGQLEVIGSFIDGKQSGERKLYFENGQLRAIVSFVDNKQNEEIKVYYESGKLGLTGNFIEGERQGEWILYNEDGTFSSTEIDETSETGLFTDSRDGKTYKTVKIGTQVWMAENLAYLPSVSPSSGYSYTDPYYYYVYGYGGTNVSEAKATSNYQNYGVLYNWLAALQACPAGWHLPTDAEWTKLENYLIANGYNYDGTTSDNKVAKSLATSNGWASSSNTGAIGNTDFPDKQNVTGFSAFPGGYRGRIGAFGSIGFFGYWWSATESGTESALNRTMFYNYSGVSRHPHYKPNGFSVRCVRDYRVE